MLCARYTSTTGEPIAAPGRMGERRMSDTFAEKLKPILSAGDLVAAWELLHSLEGEDLRAAKAWFGSNRRWLAHLYDHLVLAEADQDKRFERYEGATWIVAMCAVWLCGPATAAGRVPWRDCGDYRENEGEAAFVHLLWDMDRTWVAQFVEAASRVSLGGDARHSNGQLSRALRAAATHHALPCPTGRTFLACWTAGTGRHDSLADKLAADPFMPDLLFLYLASGHCGDLPDLPEAVAELCARDVVARTDVLEAVLEQLTAAQRPGSQTVLARMTTALGLKPTEIPGGLTYLLGVLATSYKTVVPVLLPHALDLVEDAEGLDQLARVLAARPEKRPKEMFLAALKTTALQAAVGKGAVLAALDVLGSGDDAAFSEKVARAAAALTVNDSRQPLPAASAGSPADLPALGLWDLQPTPAGLRPAGWMSYRDYGWKDVLDSRAAHRERLQPLLVDRALAAMTGGSFQQGERIREVVDKLLGVQRLSMSALGSVFDDLFLGGGLRQGWATALAVTDAACAAPRRPAGLDNLLRTLARYVDEVPRPWEVPPHLAALAAGDGRTKTESEARVLVAGLLDVPVETALARLRDSGSKPERPRPARRGLWESTPAPTTPLPSSRRLADPFDEVVDAGRDLNRLRTILSEDFNGYAQNYDDVCYVGPGYSRCRASSGLTYPERALAATVEAVRIYGRDAVRAALAGIERQYQPLDVVLAIDCWAAGTLDEAALWRVLRHSAPELRLREVWSSQAVENRAIHERLRALPPFSARLARPDQPEVAALVLPSELSGPADRLAFVRAGEALLMAERHETPMLCTPTWADGTLDLDDLLRRLGEAASTADRTVGPIDLVQALHRLRPVDPARATEVPHGLQTAVLFADHGETSRDATELVRTWVAQGGLPDLDARPDENGHWSSPTVAPVPFSSLTGLPPELADDPWCPGAPLPTLRMMPRWGDRVVHASFGTAMTDHPAHFPGHFVGPFGVPLHDRLLSLMAPFYNTHRLPALPSVLDFAQRGRLVPAAAAAAATGRHEAGTLRLGIMVKFLQRGFEEGGLRGLWPTALAVADALCAVPKRPSALPDLLRLLTSYAHEVPASAVEIPPLLLRLAESRGSTKSHLGARELVDALQRAAAS